MMNGHCMIKSSPIEKYNADLKQEGFQYDAAQEHAVNCLQRLFEDLQNKPIPVSGFKKVLSGWKKTYSKQKPVTIKGLYFWGGVGRGKTYLVDTFYDCLPFNNKMRVHFHRLHHMASWSIIRDYIPVFKELNLSPISYYKNRGYPFI